MIAGHKIERGDFVYRGRDGLLYPLCAVIVPTELGDDFNYKLRQSVHDCEAGEKVELTETE